MAKILKFGAKFDLKFGLKGGRLLLPATSFQPIALNKIGQGQPDTQDEHTNNLFLQTRGLPKPATGDQARYILEPLADVSRPFGTTVAIKGDTAEINLKHGN